MNGWNFHIAHNAVFGRAEKFAVVRAFFLIGLAGKKGIVIDFGLLECVGQIGILNFCKCLFVLGQDNGSFLLVISVPERRVCGCPDADEEKNKKKNVQQNSLFVHKSLLN